jgi:hypothetical protein
VTHSGFISAAGFSRNPAVLYDNRLLLREIEAHVRN